LQVPDNHLMPTYDFTVEAFIVLRSVDDGATVRTIASRWDGRKDQPGWSFGVTVASQPTNPKASSSNSSATRPRTARRFTTR